MYSACFFDFDYTLGDATKGIVESVNYAISNMGFPTYPSDKIKRTIGMSLPETFTDLTQNSDALARENFVKLFVEKADAIMTLNTEMLPGSVEILSFIKSKGIKTGIVTTKYHYRIIEILDKFNINHLIDVVVGSEDVKYPKPHPEALLIALEKLGLNNQEVLYIGDSTIDAKAARNAHVDFIAVTTGTTKRDDFLKYQCIDVISSLSELKSKTGLFKWGI